MPRAVKDTKEKGKSGRASSVSREEDMIDTSMTTDKNEKQVEKTLEKQVRIDKMLSPVVEGSPLEDIATAIHSIESRLEKLASKEYIENSLKKLVSADFVNEKLTELRVDLSKEIKNELDKAYDHLKKVNSIIETSQKDIDELREKYSGLQIETELVTKEKEVLIEKTKDLDERIWERDIRIKTQEKNINDLEQYTRRNSIRIYGLDDKEKNESFEATCNLVISTLNHKLNLKLVPRDIDISHRIGKFTSDSNRPVICKFVSRMVKKNVMSVRRKLKGSSIVIREDLTIKNAKLLEEVSAKDEVENAWSDDGKILAVLRNGKKVRFDINSDLTTPLIPAEELAILLAENGKQRSKR